MARGGEIDKLVNLGIEDISPKDLWRSDITQMAHDGGGDAWWSRLYGKEMSVSAVGRYANELEPWMLDMISDQCGATSVELGVATG